MMKFSLVSIFTPMHAYACIHTLVLSFAFYPHMYTCMNMIVYVHGYHGINSETFNLGSLVYLCVGT